MDVSEVWLQVELVFGHEEDAPTAYSGVLGANSTLPCAASGSGLRFAVSLQRGRPSEPSPQNGP